MVKLSCGESCMKYLLFFCNLLFFLLGLVALVVGVIIKVNGKLIDNVTSTLLEQSYSNSLIAIILIILGLVILLIAACGCFGACKESSCLLGLYSFILVILILVQLVCAILAGVYWSEIQKMAQDELEDVVKTKVGNEANNEYLEAMNFLQSTFKCCGATGYKNYENSLYANDTNNNVPYSCCVLKEDNDDFDIFKTKETDVKDWTQCNNDAETGTKTANTDYLYVGGCLQSFITKMKSSLYLLIGILVAIWLFEICCVTFACCVRSALV